MSYGRREVVLLVHLFLRKIMGFTQPQRVPEGLPRKAACISCHLRVICLRNEQWRFVVSGWPRILPGHWDNRDSRTDYSESLQLCSVMLVGLMLQFQVLFGSTWLTHQYSSGSGRCRVCRPKAGSTWELQPRRDIGNCIQGLGGTLTWY